jgi:opacity protein-like surface antigen
MRLKLVLSLVFFSSTALTSLSQIAPSATQGGIPLTAGVGFSQYDSDWSGWISGATLWLDWNLNRMPQKLQGLGLEAEGRDLSFNRTGWQPKLRQDTAEGGAIYHWPYFERFHPYAKFMAGYGSIDFNNTRNPYYTHDTRTILAPGGGADYRIWRNVWLRGDYEYQFWTHFYNNHALTPAGFTIGATYDFGHMNAQ